MRFLHTKACGLVAALALALFATPAGFATTSTATLAVSASVSNNCAMNAGSLGFGSYTGLADSTATTSVTFSCTTGSPTSLAFTSTNFSAGARQLKNGANSLAYSLCIDNSDPCTSPIGQGTAETVTGATPQLTCVTQPNPTSCSVFGVIASGQSVSTSGSYSDNVTMTLTF